MSTSISIAIPFYNAEDSLADAIRCVFAQTHQNWELILINDGSTDNSLEIAQSISDDRVRVFSDGKNKKLAARLNEIIQLAKYDYILRMDADDLMSPTRVEKQLKIMLAEPELDLVSTGIYSITNDLELVGIRGYIFERATFQDVLEKKIGITHATILAKRAWFLENKYDENLSIAQDTDLWLRTLKENKLAAKSIFEPLYFYREEYNITTNKLLRAYRNERIMLKKYVDGNLLLALIKSYTKSFVVNILGRLNLLFLLQKRRNQDVVTPEIQEKFSKELQIIKTTFVRGLDKM